MNPERVLFLRNDIRREQTMHRRKILAAVLTGASAIFSITSATKPASAATTDGSKVVYHLYRSR